MSKILKTNNKPWVRVVSIISIVILVVIALIFSLKDKNELAEKKVLEPLETIVNEDESSVLYRYKAKDNSSVEELEEVANYLYQANVNREESKNKHIRIGFSSGFSDEVNLGTIDYILNETDNKRTFKSNLANIDWTKNLSEEELSWIFNLSYDVMNISISKEMRENWNLDTFYKLMAEKTGEDIEDLRIFEKIQPMMDEIYQNNLKPLNI